MGVVVPFPASKNRRKVRRVAEEALDLEGHASMRFIRKVERSIFLELTVPLGFPPRIARAEVLAFHEAVQAEMIRLTYYGHGAGGAA